MVLRQGYGRRTAVTSVAGAHAAEWNGESVLVFAEPVSSVQRAQKGVRVDCQFEGTLVSRYSADVVLFLRLLSGKNTMGNQN